MTWMAGRCGVVFGAALPFFWLAGLGLGGEPPPTQLPMLEKTRRVPWSEAFQKPSPHFQVITNTTQALADQVSSALEQQYADFVARFQIRKEPKQPLPIRIFAERAEFIHHGRGTGQSHTEHAAGYFDPNKLEIVLYWSDDPEDVLSTLYHEVTHYFVSLYIGRGNAPTWMDEGLAVYFESSQFRNGHLETGLIPYGRLLELQDALKDGTYHRLAHLMRLKEYGEGGYDLLAYAEGWAVVYFFAKAQGGRNGQNFGLYMDEIKRGRTHEVAFKKAFQATPEQLEAVWKPFILGLGMDSARGWTERALRDYYDRRFKEAVQACEEALKKDPKCAKALLIRGQAQYFLAQLPSAYESLQGATQADPKEYRAFYYLARVMEGLHRANDPRGSEAAQEAAYLKAVGLRPDYAEALGLLAWLYATAENPKLQKIKQAIPIAERAVELDPTAEVLDTLAECYFQDGQAQRAVETAKRALETQPAERKYFEEQLRKFEAAAKAK